MQAPCCAAVFGALRGGRQLICVCCQAGYLTANPFETETSDILSVNGTQYSGLGMSRGPVGLSVAANTAIEWVADFSVSYSDERDGEGARVEDQ